MALYKEPLHGYGITKKIEELSNDSHIIAPGTLYGVLKNLEKQKLITTISEESLRKKKTFCLTALGKETLLTEYQRYQNLIQFTQEILSKKEEIK